MSREEDAIRATTRAIAATVRDVPPLELGPATGELWSPGRAPRRPRRRGRVPRLLPWLAPSAAAAVVVAVAVSLVIIRGPQNEGVVPQPTPTVASSGGVPRYYVTLNPVTGQPGAANGLLVGDTGTGQTLAEITPPAHVSYQSVTAADDDRTFLAFATETGGSWMTGRWYELVLAPGTTHLVSVTSTAIEPQSGVVGSALSGSGKYLAVAENGPAKGQRRVVVFSVATGRPLRAWSTVNLSAWTVFASQQSLLTWIDGDQAIAFSAADPYVGTESVRRLNVRAPPGDGDLIADSQVIWSTPASSGPSCKFTTPLVSADGQTIACAANDFGSVPAGHQQTITWHLYRVSAQAPAASADSIAYQVTRPTQVSLAALNSDTLWVSPSGSAVIGEWAVSPLLVATPSRGSDGNASSAWATLSLGGASRADVYIGVMSHGTFTPLRLPRGIPVLTAQSIAW